MNNFLKKKYIIFLTIIAILLIVSIPTLYKVIKNYHNKLYTVVEKEITEAAIRCWNKQDCNKDTILLKDLYELDYLEKQINPVTKKVYDYNSTITKKGKNVVLDLH